MERQDEGEHEEEDQIPSDENDERQRKSLEDME